MASSGRDRADQRSLPAAGVGSHAGAVPLSHSGLPFRYGSEFIYYTVAKLLEKSRIEQTKSRPRHSNDNGLAETKNGAVVRKHMGYSHIAAPESSGHRSFLSTVLQPILELSPAVRRGHASG